MSEEPTLEMPVVEPNKDQPSVDGDGLTPSNGKTDHPTQQTFDWLQELEKIDSKDLRKHPKVAGIIGGEIQRAIKLERDRIQVEEGSKAAREAEANLRRLAEEEPSAFAQHWLSESQKKDIEEQLEKVNAKARYDMAQSIGRAFQDVPEWKELSQEEHEELARSLMGKADEEIIPLFTHQTMQIIAKKQALKLFNEWKEKDKAKDREALRQEEAAKLMKNSESPDLERPKSLPSGIDVRKMSDAEFEVYWNKHFR